MFKQLGKHLNKGETAYEMAELGTSIQTALPECVCICTANTIMETNGTFLSESLPHHYGHKDPEPNLYNIFFVENLNRTRV